MAPRGGARDRGGRPRSPNPREPISISLPRDLANALKARAAQQGVPVSAIVVDLVRAYLAEQIAQPSPAPIMSSETNGEDNPGVDEGLRHLAEAIAARDLDDVLVTELRAREANGARMFSANELARLITHLEPRQAQAMHLHHVLGVTKKAEIARRMGISAAAVAGLLSRGMTNLIALAVVNRE